MVCHFRLLRQWLKSIKVQTASLCYKCCTTDYPAGEHSWRCWFPRHSSDTTIVARTFISSWRHLTFASLHTSLSLLESCKRNLSTVNFILSHTRTIPLVCEWCMRCRAPAPLPFCSGVDHELLVLSFPPTVQHGSKALILTLWMHFSYAQLLPNTACRIRHKAAAYEKWCFFCRLCRAGGQAHY